MSTHARNPSTVSDGGSESSLTSLSSDSGRHASRPQTPRNGPGDVPGLTHSPSSSTSSPESIRRYGLSAMSSYQGVGNAVEAILRDGDFDNLYSLAQKHLEIFNNAACSHLDEPDWVKRVTSHTAVQPVFKFFTVRNLIKSMFHVAKDLKLDESQKYVAAAICSCAVEANAEGSSSEEKQMKLAEKIQRLASTWAGFLLWPFYAQQNKSIVVSVDEISESATPTISDTASLIDKGLSKTRKADLKTDVLLRDGYKCILSGNLDLTYWQRTAPEASNLRSLLSAIAPENAEDSEDDEDELMVKVEVAHIFKRSVAVYDGASQTGSDSERFHTATITFDLLRHYCQLDPKYITEADIMDKPKNAISLSEFFHSRFDDYTWCLKPTETPHCYEVIDYHRRYNHMKRNKIPARITLKDHSVEDAAASAAPDDPVSEPGPSTRSRKRPHRALGIDLPDPELLRLHAALTGVLRLSGAAEVFDDIKGRRGPGNPPVPSADGAAFFKDIVDISDLVALQEAAAQLQLTSF